VRVAQGNDGRPCVATNDRTRCVGRLAWTAARLSLLGSAPSLAALLLRAVGFELWSGAPSLASCLASSMSLKMLNAPRLAGLKKPLPLLEDPGLLARIAEISSRMGVPVPRTRVAGTLGHLQALSGVFGVQAPSLLLADGILHRLTPGERDAIIAHELAHLSNGSLWLVPACTSASGVATMWVPSRGLYSVLVYALATHPPQAARYEVLRARAPDGVLPERPGDVRRVRVHRLASTVMLSLWGSAVGAAALALRARDFWAAIALLVAVVGVQLGLPMSAMLAQRRKWSRRLGARSGLRWVFRGGALLVFLGFIWTPLFRHVLPRVLDRATVVDLWWQTARVPLSSSLVGAALLLAATVLHQRRMRLRAAIVSAMAQHDFMGAVAVGDAQRRRLRADPELRYLAAVALLLAGRRGQAVSELTDLCEGPAPLPAALFALSAISRGEPALHPARRAVQLLPDDVGARLSLAKALRDSGQHAMAERELADTRPSHLEEGHVLAVRALLACDRGEWDAAMDLVTHALSLAPGDALVLRCRAEVVQGARPDLASTALEEARAASRANPFALLDDDLNALETRLATPVSSGRRRVPG